VKLADFSPASRATLYFMCNVGFSLLVMLAAATGPDGNPRIPYLCLLMAVCSLPILWMRELNGRYVLLTAFLAAYLFFYGAADFSALLAERTTTNSRGILSAAELTVLAGGLLTVLGYRLGLLTRGTRAAARPAHDYPPRLVLAAGLVLWTLGTLGVWIWQVKIQTNAVTMSKEYGSFTLLAAVIARMLQPLGMIMLAYAWVANRSRWLLLLLAGLVCIEVFVGFVGDSKETAMRGVIILIMAVFLLQGRVSRVWLSVLVAFAVLAYPVFQAYRAEVMHMRGISRADAASDVLHSLKLALGARGKMDRKFSSDYNAPDFIGRTSLKPTIELLIAKTGDAAPFQHGYTLWLYFTGFVPRFIWPDKPDSSVGQLMNRQFRVSEDPDTYISATHLGELYWNFGYAGVALGMLCLGAMLGFINARCDLSERRSLTRLLVLVTTVYAAIVRFEGSIALEYIVFTRSLALIWIMHLLFARQPAAGRAAGSETGSQAGGEAAYPPPRPLIHAPQLMR